MKIKVFAVLFGVFSSVSVFADVLWWQVASDLKVEGVTWDAARLVYNNGTDNSVLFTTKHSGESVAEVKKDYFSVYPGYADVTDHTTGSFFIELVSKVGDGDTWSAVAYSDKVAYSNLGAALMSSAEFNAQWSSINALGSGLTFTALPEPTSGLMLLVGAAMLGLRRKRPQV